jgi:diguanylate cyclase (GGDEF)-like protein
VGSKDPFESFSSLGQLYISSASIIAVLFFFTQMKDRLRETQAVAERMTELARTDGLTGIPNRRCIEEAIDLEIERSRRYDLPLSLITFDLDNFKRLNDTFGHDAGDRVLIEVARLVEPHLRANDRFGRWGGEEFTIVAPETTAESARHLADRLRAAIEDYDFGLIGRLSASFGVAAYGAQDSTTILVKRADVALYRAKAFGRNRAEAEIAV